MDALLVEVRTDVGGPRRGVRQTDEYESSLSTT
jgi:hypothetical protein